MDTSTIKQHLLDFLKGFVAAVAVAAGSAALQYLGAHIPDLLTFLGTVIGGVAGVKAGK